MSARRKNLRFNVVFWISAGVDEFNNEFSAEWGLVLFQSLDAMITQGGAVSVVQAGIDT